MQILIDMMKLQKKNGFKSKRKLTANVKDDADALQELTELLQAVFSEAIDRDLPIDKAFAALHINNLNKTGGLNYAELLDKYRNTESLKHIRQQTKGVDMLQELHSHYKVVKNEKK